MIRYKGGFKYQLHEDAFFQLRFTISEPILTRYISLSVDGILTIHSGYAWDGPSGPTIDTKNSMQGSLVHDALYQLIRMSLLSPHYRAPADRELERICIEDGMWKIRAKTWRNMVNWFAVKSSLPENKREIFTAP